MKAPWGHDDERVEGRSVQGVDGRDVGARDVDDGHRDNGLAVTRSEEELVIDRVAREAGHVRVRKDVTTEHVQRTIGRGVEHAAVERTPAFDDDAGEVVTYDDGSVSIPVLEEELVVTRRVVVRERLLVRKHTEVEETTVEADLRGEEIHVQHDEAVRDRVERA